MKDLKLYKLMQKHRQEGIDQFLDKFKDFKVDFTYANISTYNNAREEMEFYESLPQDLDITTMEDVVGLVVNYQIDKGGCWRFDMQVEEKLEGVVHTYFYWFEVNEWYFDYDFWREE